MIRIINADVVDGLRSLPEKSVHCVVTSPPYWGLRDYGIEGQIGLEPTPEEYLEKMVQVFREVKRVLREDGTLWLNMGDNYATGGYQPHDKGAFINGYDCPAGWSASGRGQGAMETAGERTAFRECEGDHSMNHDQWRREILYHCDNISVVDRDFARCRYEKPYPEPTHECCYEKCPKRVTTSNETSG